MSVRNVPLLEGRTAIVTGAARGIGAAIVQLLLDHGANVVANDVLAIDSEGRSADRFMPVQGDVSSEPDVARMVSTALDHFGRIDCLVNNAGDPGSPDALAALSPDSFDRTVSIVLRGVFLTIHHVVPAMRQHGGGTIINIGSTSALRAAAGLHAYSAAKAAVVMLTQNAAVELASDGIRVNCVCPGGIATAMYGIAAGLEPSDAVDRIEIIADNLAGHQLLKRAGRPEDVANAVLWLASDLASYVTGQILAVDGGMSTGRPMPLGATVAGFFRSVAGV